MSLNKTREKKNRINLKVVNLRNEVFAKVKSFTVLKIAGKTSNFGVWQVSD